MSEWNHIRPSETRGSKDIAIRQKGPRWPFYLAMFFMTIICLSLLYAVGFKFDIWNIVQCLIVFGAWANIAASETDVNSPLNQTLMDKIRENLDFLKAAIEEALTLNLNGSDSTAGAGTTLEITLDSSIDWRDRNITVQGMIAGTRSLTDEATALADVQKILPGGTEDDEVFFDSLKGTYGTPTFTSSDPEWDYASGFFYSGAGSGAYSTKPYLHYPGIDGNIQITDFYVWVDASGDLKLTMVSANVANRATAYTFRVTYSNDQGGV